MEFWKVVAGILGSFGGAGIIIFALSSWLGKIWADRLMQGERVRYEKELEELKAGLEISNNKQLEILKRELDTFQVKYLSAHHDKIATYRLAADSVARLLSDITGLYTGAVAKEKMPATVHEFERERLRLYAYIGMLAPQSVMDTYTSLTDYLTDVLALRAEYKWDRVRDLAIRFLNEIRKDIGIDSSNIVYNKNIEENS